MPGWLSIDLGSGKNSEDGSSDDEIEKTDEPQSEGSPKEYYPPPPQAFPTTPYRSYTARTIAVIVVGSFAASVLFCVLFTFLLLFKPVRQIEYTDDGSIRTERSHDFSDAFELFKSVSSVMAGPLGFVLGFYFRESSSS
ncbi:MAG: hypothetical protein ACFB14_14040 [Leptolyngbyaceae cyanobacterium]